MSVMVVMVVMEDLCVAWYSDTTGILQVTLQPCSGAEWAAVPGCPPQSAVLCSYPGWRLRTGYSISVWWEADTV